MRKHFLFILIVLCFTGTKIFGQEHLRIINLDEIAVQYLEKKDGGASTAIKNITVKVEYFTDNVAGAADATVEFELKKSSSPKSDPEISMEKGQIKKDKFKTSKDTIQQITLACSNRINFAIFVRLNPMQEIP